MLGVLLGGLVAPPALAQLASVAPPVHVPGEIDALRTTAQVARLMRRLEGRAFFPFQVDTLPLSPAVCPLLRSTDRPQPWVRADFDGNGHTDLLVRQRQHNDVNVWVVWAEGAGHYRREILRGRGKRSCEVALLTSVAGRPAIVYRHMVVVPGGDMLGDFRPQHDTLVYRFGALVEYHRRPGRHRLEQAEFELVAGTGWSETPHFTLTLQPDGQVRYEEKEWIHPNRPPVLRQTAQLDSATRARLLGLAGYLLRPDLAGAYSVNWTDDITVALRLRYDGGRQISIHDYGARATFGLTALYEAFFTLRRSLQWQNVPPDATPTR